MFKGTGNLLTIGA